MRFLLLSCCSKCLWATLRLRKQKKYSKDMGFTMGVSLDMVGCTRGSNYKMEISPVWIPWAWEWACNVKNDVGSSCSIFQGTKAFPFEPKMRNLRLKPWLFYSTEGIPAYFPWNQSERYQQVLIHTLWTIHNNSLNQILQCGQTRQFWDLVPWFPFDYHLHGSIAEEYNTLDEDEFLHFMCQQPVHDQSLIRTGGPSVRTRQIAVFSGNHMESKPPVRGKSPKMAPHYSGSRITIVYPGTTFLIFVDPF